MQRNSVLALILSGSFALTAHAQNIEPGLWEMTSSNAIAGQNLPDVQALMANIPAEQRAMMEQMLSDRGISLGQNGGVRVCLTEQQIAQNNIPLNDSQSGCQQTVTERSDTHWKFNFSCPEGKGEGVVQFVSSKEFTTEVQGQFKYDGMTQNGTMKTRGKWVQSSCGNVKPQS